ncbi:MAG TPA: hypothetical protein VFF65_12045, partial [Phycisphaerales bacterium]|nr:hypothetical protein [Phycisphaerales bacterium]
MKKTQVLALLALAGASTAFAAPRESVTFNAVESNGLQGAGATMTTTFAGSDGGGAYNATYL